MSRRSPTPPDADPAPPHLELLAPAGDRSALEAALEAGADAVYFGLTSLNARRRAKNCAPEELAQVVAQVHQQGARAYLTLNIDLAEREVGQAARILELARQAGVDAVLVRDPALLVLRKSYPEIEFHFSTQTCMANSADVQAARRLGASRVVLAREMTLGEIAAASRVRGVATEVFAQGALCFCISGRCLLSSWVGGRSGNRGTCTSPCRVPWNVAGEPAETPLSMRDLATVHRLDDLRHAGVTAMKIEGRLKTADWVRQAVGLYRQAIEGPPEADLLQRAQPLGAYTGRLLSCGYLDGRRDELTGLAGRGANASDACHSERDACDSERDARHSERSEESAPNETLRSAQGDETPEPAQGDETAEPLPDDETADPAEGYELEITVGDRAVVCQCLCRGQQQQWSIPKTVVHRAPKAVSIGKLLERLAGERMQGLPLIEARTNDPDYLLVRRAANALVDRVGGVLRQARKAPEELVRIDLPEPVRGLLAHAPPHAANRRALGEAPDRVRLDARTAAGFLKHVRPEAAILEGLTPPKLEKLLAAVPGVRLVAALPGVFFENDIPFLRRLVRACVQAQVTVEVNSWGGLYLARRAGARMEGGPGLGVLNSLAARTLGRKGLRGVTLSVEADRRQWEEITAHCPLPCSLAVFGRPPLMQTRVALPREQVGQVFEDRRGVKMIARRERGLYVFRPVEPFDLRSTHNERIRVAHLVADLVGSPEPLEDWYEAGPRRRAFRFNYDRTLG